MRFLKNKIAKAMEIQAQTIQQDLKSNLVKSEHSETNSQTTCHSVESPKIAQVPVNNIKVEKVTKTTKKEKAVAQPKAAKPVTTSYKASDAKAAKINKNIVRNYARAIINFTLCDTALIHMAPLSEAENINILEFRQFMNKHKEEINSIRSLRDMLLIADKDDAKMIGFKKVFKAVCELFIKYFSVNWIYNSKLHDKAEHLNYRFKILRRVRNPEFFTYLKNFKHA